MNTMRVAAIIDEKKVEIRDTEKPVIGKNEVLIKIMACGLCTWEQRVYLGVKEMPFPFVGGHEVAGIIEQIGGNINIDDIKVGDKVAVRTLENCGTCYYCRVGKENLCVEEDSFLSNNNGFYGQGGLAQYMAVDESKVFKLDDSIPFRHGAFSEPLACVVNSVEQGEIELGNDVVIIGAGIMGLLHTMIAKIKGARIIVSEPNKSRRKHAEELGADITFDPTQEEFVEKVTSLTNGRGADVIFNTTAIPSIAKQAIEATGKLGRVVMYSSIYPDELIEISPNWIHSAEVKITGAVSPSIKSFKTSVELLSKKIINPDSLISAEYPLEQAYEAFEQAIKPETYRIIIKE